MSKAIWVDAIGGIENIRVGRYEPGEPKAGEALVRQTVMGVNYSDVLMRKGSHGVTAPFILGREGVGVVEAVGAGIGTVKVGDRVAYTSLAGGTSKSATCRSGRDSSVCCRCHARQRGR